jgi:flagellar hook-basal body complex protein FliE
MAIEMGAKATGDLIGLRVTDPRHFTDGGALAGAGAAGTAGGGTGPESAFGSLLANALGSVHDSQLKGMELTQKMITDPESVSVNDLTVALAEANLALSMTKAVVDRALSAYREIINVR